jgi:hypothetical protein
MSNYKRKEVMDYLIRKPVTTQDIELARTRIQTPVTPLPMQETSGEGLGTVQEFNEGGRVEFAEGSISPKQIEIAKKIYGKDFKELTPNQRYKIKRGDLKPGSISFEQYLEDYKKMTNDPNYKPEYIKPATGTGLSAEQRRARTEAAQSIEGFEEKLLKNINKNKKLKRSLDPEKREYDLSRKAERRDLKRLKEKDVSLSPREAEINLEQRKLQRSINQVIRKNPNLILNNKDLMDKLSITISKEGDIIKVPTTINEKYLKERGLFEIDHQRDIYKEGRGKNLPYNRNLILGPYNRTGGFKDAAEKFIQNNPTSDKITDIVEKAKELKITLQPNVPEGTFKTKGIGYKQIADPIGKFKDVAKPIVDTFNEPSLAARMSNKLSFDPTGIGNFLETSLGQSLSKSTPNLLKTTAKLSAITGTPINALLGVALYADEFKEKGLGDLETIAAGAYKGSTQDLLNFGDLIFRKLPVATYEKFVEDKPFLESLLDKPEYFEFADKQIDKYASEKSIKDRIQNMAEYEVRKSVTPNISDTEVPTTATSEEYKNLVQNKVGEILNLNPDLKNLYEQETTIAPEPKTVPKQRLMLGPIAFPEYTQEELNLAKGGRVKFASGSDDPESDLYIPPLNEKELSETNFSKEKIDGLYFRTREEQRPIPVDPMTGKPISSGGIRELKQVFSSLLSDTRPEAGYRKGNIDFYASKGINPFQGDTDFKYGASYTPEGNVGKFMIDKTPQYLGAGYTYEKDGLDLGITGLKDQMGDKSITLRFGYKYAKGGKVKK